MEQIPFATAAIIGTALVGAIGVLWKYGTNAGRVRDKECKARVLEMEKKIAEIYTMLVKKSDAEVVKTEAREARAWERALELSRVLERVSEVTRHAIRVIRRNEPKDNPSVDDTTPLPRDTRFEPTYDARPTPQPASYNSPLSDETSRFVKDGEQQ